MHGEDKEEALLAAARDGDRGARGELHGLVRASVGAYLRHTVGRRAGRTLTVEDLEQDAFLYAFEALPALEDVTSVDAFRALVLRQARWRAFKEMRRAHHFAGESELGRPLDAQQDVADASRAGEVTRHDQYEHLAAQVDRLAEKQAEVVRLRMMGTEFAAIGEELAISAEAVRKRYARGLAELRALMDASAS